jgi:hypothetical protein
VPGLGRKPTLLRGLGCSIEHGAAKAQ